MSDTFTLYVTTVDANGVLCQKHEGSYLLDSQPYNIRMVAIGGKENYNLSEQSLEVPCWSPENKSFTFYSLTVEDARWILIGLMVQKREQMLKEAGDIAHIISSHITPLHEH